MVATVSAARSANSHPQLVGEVGQQRAFGTRIMHRRNASALGPPPGREQFEGVAELGQIADVHGAGRRAERLPRRMLAGQCPGVCGHHRAAARRAADGEDHHGHVLLRGAQQGLPQPRDGPRCLEQQADDARFGIVQRVVHVVSGVGHEFLPGRHRQPKAEPAAGTQQRRERRARMGDEADRHRRGNGSGSRYPSARTPSALFTKPMQPAPHNAIPASVAIAVIVSRRPCADPNNTADRAPVGGRGGQLVGQHGVRTRRAVPRRRARRDRPVTARTAARRCGRSADSPDGSAPNLVVPQGPCASRSCPGGDWRPPPPSTGRRAWRRPPRGVLASCLDAPSLRSSLVPRCDPHSGLTSGVHRERRNRRMPRFLSASAARAACQPGIPHTPPPACVPELPLYSPAIGVR